MEAELRWHRMQVWACGLCLVLLLAGCCPGSEATFVGVCYGQCVTNLPSSQKVVQLLQAQSIPRVRLFNADSGVLRALAYTNIQVVVGMTNSEMSGVAQSEAVAYAWVSNNVAAYLPATRIIAIAVGSEVITSPLNISSLLVPAMINLNSALVSAGLDGQVKVSTPHAMGVIQNSFPPSAGSFYSSFVPVIQPLLSFLSQTQSFFMVNVYPFYTFQNENPRVSLDYALFQPKTGTVDPNSGLVYFNLFDAQVDAVYYALEALGYSNLSLVITETGWPSMGYASEVNVVNFQNAAAYNGNLIKHILQKNGTPLKPGIGIDTYIFELFNEDQLPGPTSVRNWGLFRPDGTKYYDISFGGQGSISGGTVPSGNPGQIPIVNRTFCITSVGASFTGLQSALDWACGKARVDCSAIQPGQDCYLPDTVASHASYAFNSYYQDSGMDPSSCSFSGLASITSLDPSYGKCVYEGSYMSIARLSVSEPLWVLQLLAVFLLLISLQQ
ncbi:hypothetical protein O6H91_Y407300 [Diphasiastrum complanatum]|nr:hypothetical protein O6H91_Y407300 [Diphasiastrum complanatum]